MIYDIENVNYNANLTYYVWFYDFNQQKLTYKNIFYEGAVEKIIKNIKMRIDSSVDSQYELNYENVKEIIEAQAKYDYWAQTEYELKIGDLFEKDLNKYKKIDIYDQIMLNLDLITQYFCDNVFIKTETNRMSVNTEINELPANNENDKDKQIKELSEKIEDLNNQLKKLKLQDIPYLNGYIDGMREFQKLN